MAIYKEISQEQNSIYSCITPYISQKSGVGNGVRTYVRLHKEFDTKINYQKHTIAL